MADGSPVQSGAHLGALIHAQSPLSRRARGACVHPRRLRRHVWRQRKVEIDDTVWDRLPDKAPVALQQLENDQVIVALHRAVQEHLTERQRLIFQSVTLDEVPIDVLAERLGASRGAIYKTLHDARAKLRRALTVSGHGERVS